MTNKTSETLNAAIAGAQPKIAVIAVSGGIWQCSPVSEKPEVLLEDWAVYEVKLPWNEHRTRHFAGTKIERGGGSGRVSTAIVSFDPTTRRGVTESGRVYELVRQRTGLMRDAEYTWNHWKSLHRAEDAVDVTDEIKALLPKGRQK
ncbi:hypothetical protein os4_23180 [Comamonadaceae bacterium OS-4]|nr:hypothetical protein os4_23180 [Comamonadaceae bacterium OS-4]